MFLNRKDGQLGRRPGWIELFPAFPFFLFKSSTNHE
jgi:hypothetical protein